MLKKVTSEKAIEYMVDQQLLKQGFHIAKTLQGPIGPRGPKGEKGDKGDSIVGPMGPPGIDGKDGESIVGPMGPAGKPGRDGKDGLNGRDGESIVGPRGEDGKPGIQGPPPRHEVDPVEHRIRFEKEDGSWGEWIDLKRIIVQKMLGSGGGGGGGIADLSGFTTDDLPEGITNLYFTDERAQDAVFNAISASTSIAVTYNDAGNALTLDVLPGGVDHGSLAGISDDDHTQYALLNGRSGGQTLTGGTASGNNLVLRSTTNGTKGQVYIDETTAATSTTTGALRVGGGAGIGGRTHTVGLTSSGNILPSANQTIDLGTTSLRMRELNFGRIRGYYDVSLAGTNAINSSTLDTGTNYILSVLGGAGTRTANLAGSGFFGYVNAVMYTDTDVSTTATINAQDNGVIVLGGATTFASSFGNAASLDTTGASGSTIIGYAFCNGGVNAADTALIGSYGQGSLALGSCGHNNFTLGTGGCSNTMSASAIGSFVCGSLLSTDAASCTGTMSAGAEGSMVQGAIAFSSSSASGTTATISTTGTGGSLARGFCSRGSIESNNQGSFASGFVAATSNSTALRASGLASIALGRIVNTGSIISSGLASFVSGNSNGSGTVTGSGAGSLSVFSTTSSGTTTNSGAGAIMAASLSSSAAITQSGAGSLVITQATSSGTVTVSAAGSLFIGRVNSTGNASVTGTAGNFIIGDMGTVGGSVSGTQNCGLFGQGTNSITDSVKFGETIRVLELQSASLASNGDIGMNSGGIVSIRSNGINREVQKEYQNRNFSVTSVGNVGTGVDDLISHTLAASSLTVDGDYARYSGFGTFAANANNKQVRALWNGTEVVTTGAVAINGGTWESMVTIVRISSSNARCFGRITVKDGGGVVTTYYGSATIATTWTGTVIAKHTGEATSNNDIVQEIGHLDRVRVS